MDKLTLATKEHDGTWFGVLTSDQGRLIASSFSKSKVALERHPRRIRSGPRAVGTGVARNPWPLFIPCHRVVPASLEIGNYSIGGALSDYGCAVKRDLLEREGVSIEGDKIASKALWVPTGA